VGDVECTQTTGLKRLADPNDLPAETNPREVQMRLRELEREMTQASRQVTPAKSESSPPLVDADQSVDVMALLFGAGLTVVGAYLVMQRVTLTGGSFFWNRWGLGQNGFGLTLIPLLIGIGLLIYGKTALGWALTGFSSLIILVGILANLQMTFRSASLFEVVLMFGMLAAGLGLVARSFRKA
jgi:hypothetical protein